MSNTYFTGNVFHSFLVIKKSCWKIPQIHVCFHFVSIMLIWLTSELLDSSFLCCDRIVKCSFFWKISIPFESHSSQPGFENRWKYTNEEFPLKPRIVAFREKIPWIPDVCNGKKVKYHYQSLCNKVPQRWEVSEKIWSNIIICNISSINRYFLLFAVIHLWSL